MKLRIISLFFVLSALFCNAFAQSNFVNLTPLPKSMTVGSGELVLPSEFSISCSSLNSEMKSEVARFVNDFNLASGYKAKLVDGDGSALVQVEKLGANGKLGSYSLSVTSSGVVVKADEELGLYYALQSVKKMLPANVMAGVPDKNISKYALPVVNIDDEPRFEYRGFMLDVSRHFFTVEEVKRMIDVMSYYKMNRFHWHLSDDQGWRVEIKKYPKLTSVGSISPNSRFTDMYSCTQYWINKPYGPYYYTQEDIVDVVEYAKERHIEIVPEIDMPGHFVAAMAAYPEYSCQPDGSHIVWSDGGISSDVLNVGNPQAVQFAKDILSELIELFPYETIHIGGDECPTTAWESNDQCKAKMASLGLTNYRQLQSVFIKEIDEFVKSKGRKLAVWNEAITAGGADTQMIKNTDAIVYCWVDATAAVSKASQLGMQNIFTPIGPYYINRKQGTSPQDPPGAGPGTDDVKATYNQSIPSGTNYGVQGTFWCEHVSDREYMEWLALPRLIAIAEAGWTPQSRRNFSDFQKRISADTTLLNYGDYRYCKYHMLVDEGGNAGGESSMVMPKVNTESKKYYYRLVTGATDATRSGRCMELLSAQSSLISEYSAKGAAEGVLWTAAQASATDANYDYQWWSIEADPSGSGKYALVCKAQPNGSVNPTPSAVSTAGRWHYDSDAKHYNFVLGSGAYGVKGTNYYYSLTSDNVNTQYMNASLGGQGMAVNVYADPNDGNGGCWEFVAMENYDGGQSGLQFEALKVASNYMFVNAVDGFDSTTIVDNGQLPNLQHSVDVFANNAWQVTEAKENADGTQTVKLKNVVTDRCVSSLGTFAAQLGNTVSLSTNASEIVVKSEGGDELRLMVGGKSLFPLPGSTVNAGATVSGATYDAPRLQGAAWKAVEVKVVTFRCVDSNGANLGEVKRSVPISVDKITSDLCPTVKGAQVKSVTAVDGEVNTYDVVYERTHYVVTYRCITDKHAIVENVEQLVEVGKSAKLEAPKFKYFDCVSTDITGSNDVVLESDKTYTCTYTTKGYVGAKDVAELVTTMPTAGHQYLIYDATTASGRMGFRRIVESTSVINRAGTAQMLDPNGVWTIESVAGAASNVARVKNEYNDLYVPSLQRGGTAYASSTGDQFTFNLNSDGETWNIKGTNGMYWDGESNGDLVGWDGGTGHPIKIYTFYAQVMFPITIECYDASGNKLQSSKRLFPADEEYEPIIPVIEGCTVKSIEGLDGYNGVVEGALTIKVVYEDSTGIVGVSEDKTQVRTGIYDLQGRRLKGIENPGIYIVDGKKVIVR